MVERKGESPAYELKLKPCDFLPVTEDWNSQRGERTWKTESISRRVQRVPQTSTYGAMSSRYERYIKKLLITATVITVTPPPPQLTFRDSCRSNQSQNLLRMSMQLLKLWNPVTVNPRGHNIAIPRRRATMSLSQAMLLRENGERPRASKGTRPTTGAVVKSKSQNQN